MYVGATSSAPIRLARSAARGESRGYDEYWFTHVFAISAVGTTTIRRLEAVEEYRQCETLQERIWGAGDVAGNRLVAMLTAQENGGQVFGAFTDDEQLVGLAYSFIGWTPQRRLKLCSICRGVDPLSRAWHRLSAQAGPARNTPRPGYRTDYLDIRSIVAGQRGPEHPPTRRDRTRVPARSLRHLRRAERRARNRPADRRMVAAAASPAVALELTVPGGAGQPPVADPQTGLPRIVSTDADVDDDDLFLAVPPNFAELKRT